MKPLSEGIQRMIESNVARSDGQDDERQSESSSESDETEIDESDDELNDSDDESSFKNQVNGMTQWINELSPCQQVVSVLSLLSCLNPSQRTFILNHMTYAKQHEADAQNAVLETEANRLSFWQQFFQSNPNPGKEQMIDLLLQKLPLVSPIANKCNSSLTLLYLHLITSSLNAVTSSPNPSSKQMLEKCRDLLSLSFVSALFSPEQKKNFLNPFTAKLMIQSNENAYIQSTLRSSMRRGDECRDLKQGPNVGSNAAHIRPFSGAGMSGVAPYLKGLRLHKYTNLFASLPSLNHFLNLTDDQLEHLGVAAKGARKKFVQSLAKLKARPDQLKILFNCRSLGEILPVISDVIGTPLCKDSPEVNLILHLLLKAKDEMDVEHEKEFQEILNKCLQQPIWTREQMRLLFQMRSSGGQSSCTSSPSPSASVRFKSMTAPSNLSSHHSNQLEKQMQNLCLAMTEKALNNV